MSVFDHVPKAPVDPIFGVKQAYTNDKDPNKVDLGVGAYRDNDGKPWVLPAVREAEKINFDNHPNHEYLNIDGLPEFIKGSAQVALGDAIAGKTDRVTSIQALSGTGSLRVAGEFFRKFMPGKPLYLTAPTWSNHFSVFQDAGIEVKTYRYYSPQTLGLDYVNLLEDLKAATPGSIIILHACAHNPTGVDPTQEQWQGILDVFKTNKLFPFFDMAYQGFATGDLQRDNYAIRLFAEQGLDIMVAQSFAKNFGLYGERVGALHVVLSNPDATENVKSQLKLIARAMYSNPPSYGARIVSIILSKPELYQMWKDNMKLMSGRIDEMRKQLYAELKKLNTPGSWEHIINQIGMFTYTGLNEAQVARLTSDFHIYLLKSGRISMCGLNTNNVAYVAKAIHAVVTEKQ